MMSVTGTGWCFISDRRLMANQGILQNAYLRSSSTRKRFLCIMQGDTLLQGKKSLVWYLASNEIEAKSCNIFCSFLCRARRSAHFRLASPQMQQSMTQPPLSQISPAKWQGLVTLPLLPPPAAQRSAPSTTSPVLSRRSATLGLRSSLATLASPWW